MPDMTPQEYYKQWGLLDANGNTPSSSDGLFLELMSPKNVMQETKIMNGNFKGVVMPKAAWGNVYDQMQKQNKGDSHPFHDAIGTVVNALTGASQALADPNNRIPDINFMPKKTVDPIDRSGQMQQLGWSKIPDQYNANFNVGEGKDISAWGREGDTELAHVAPGETIVPPEVLDANPHLRTQIQTALAQMGVNPDRYVVGSHEMSINPMTGQPEFFLGGIGKALKKIAGSAIGKIALTALGAAVGAPYLGPAVSGGLSSAAATKLGGGSWGEAIGSGVGSYLGASFAPGVGEFGPSGTVGASLASNGLGSLASSLPSALVTANTAGLLGSFVGSSVGQSIGASIDPPKTEAWGNQAANMPSGINTTPTIPTGSTGGVALPGSTKSASTDGPAPYNLGAGSGTSSIPGITYLSPTKDRFTGDTTYKPVDNSVFSMNFDRRNNWGSGVTFA